MDELVKIFVVINVGVEIKMYFKGHELSEAQIF
jgi:hypothetical protein